MADSTEEDEQLQALSKAFMMAMAARRAGDVDGAVEALRGIVRKEPRLPEPHYELGHIHLVAARLDEAELEARTALKWLHQGGQWVDDVPEHVMLALAHGLLGEVLRQKAATDAVVFGDPEIFETLLDESKLNFAQAQELDPDSEHADHHSFFMELDGEDMPRA